MATPADFWPRNIFTLIGWADFGPVVTSRLNLRYIGADVIFAVTVVPNTQYWLLSELVIILTTVDIITGLSCATV